MIKLKRIEFDVLKSLPTSRDFTDIVRSSGISPSSVRGILERIRRSFLIRGFFHLSGLGYQLYLVRKEFDPILHIRLVPFIIEKIPVLVSKSRSLTFYLVMGPPEGRDEVADILKVDPDTVTPVRRFVWRPDVARGLTLKDADLNLEIDYIRENFEKVVVPSFEPPIRQRPDHIDLWIIAELARNPFVKLSSIARSMGIKQQVASYHYLQHVRPFHIFNAVTPRFSSLNIPGVFLEISVKNGMADQLAWALTNHPYIREAFSASDGNVYALTYLQGRELWDLYKFLKESDSIEDLRLYGVLIDEIKEYTPPFGEAFREDPYNLRPMYEAVQVPSKASGWMLYEIT